MPIDYNSPAVNCLGNKVMEDTACKLAELEKLTNKNISICEPESYYTSMIVDGNFNIYIWTIYVNNYESLETDDIPDNLYGRPVPNIFKYAKWLRYSGTKNSVDIADGNTSVAEFVGNDQLFVLVPLTVVSATNDNYLETRDFVAEVLNRVYQEVIDILQSRM